jgi:hypothetical protein
MGRVRVVCFHIRSSKGGIPHMCRLRADRLAPVSKVDYVMMHTGFMGPTNLVALTVAELDDTPLHLTDVHWDSVRVTHGCPSRYHVEDLH